MNKRIEDIECLRAVAVIAVVIHHANGNLFTALSPGLATFYTYFGGWFGVDLFFAISGFVIARDLLPRLAATASWREAMSLVFSFWLRRAFRLFPAAWLWLCIILVLCTWFNQSGVFGSWQANWEATVAGVLQFANVRFVQTFGRSEYGVSFSYWSLSHEEQFYMLLPLLALLLRRYLTVALLAIALLQMLSTRNLWMMAFRTDALALGVLLALWEPSAAYREIKAWLGARRAWAMLLQLCALLGLAFMASDAMQQIGLRLGVIATLAVILVWVASCDLHVFPLGGTLREVFLWIGARSYGIYLVHIPVFFAIREVLSRTGQSSNVFLTSPFILAMAASTLIAIVSQINFKVVELPWRSRGQKLAKWILVSRVP
jgi:peptidoglycan/LPS O-acetylase OafA/YrhL